MNSLFNFTKAEFKVFSAIFSNLIAFALLAIAFAAVYFAFSRKSSRSRR